MKRLDRITALMLFLQSRKSVSAQQIQEKYGISIRTVYRDIRTLTEAGLPIGFAPKIGYFIVEGYYLPPVRFTDREARAVILAERLMEKYGDATTQKVFEQAVLKIKAVLGDSQKDKLDQFERQVRTYTTQERFSKENLLTKLQDAHEQQEILRLHYTNAAGIRSERDIEVIGLTFYSHQWHAIAWCWNRLAYRDFSISKMHQLTATRQSFKKLDHLSLAEFIQQLEAAQK